MKLEKVMVCFWVLLFFVIRVVYKYSLWFLVEDLVKFYLVINVLIEYYGVSIGVFWVKDISFFV